MADQDKINAALRAEIGSLKMEVVRLRAALEAESKDTTKNLGLLTKDIIEIYDYLMPALHTLFPKIGEGKKEIAAFFKKRPHSEQQKKN